MSLPGTGTGWDKIDPKKSKPFLKKGFQKRETLPKKGLKENVKTGSREKPRKETGTKKDTRRKAREQKKVKSSHLQIMEN